RRADLSTETGNVPTTFRFWVRDFKLVRRRRIVRTRPLSADDSRGCSAETSSVSRSCPASKAEIWPCSSISSTRLRSSLAGKGCCDWEKNIDIIRLAFQEPHSLLDVNLLGGETVKDSAAVNAAIALGCPSQGRNNFIETTAGRVVGHVHL